MTELFTDTVLNMMTTTAEPEDYTGEDGLLYCGKCRTAKEAYFPKETAAWLGHDKHPTECDCQREKRLECESAEERRRHLDTVMELKRRGFTDLTMQEWTFAHDNGKCPQMSKAHLYVEHWEQMRENNYGSMAGYRISSTERFSRWISSTNRMSPSLRFVSSAARSPGFSMAGPEVIRMLTPIS